MEAARLKSLASHFEEKLKKIKVCAFDVDGILTDGKVWWAGEEVGWNRFTHTRDGYGLKFLQRAGYKVGVITGGDSLSISKRFEENLGVDFVFKGSENKTKAFEKLMEEGFKEEEILFMGDEFFDMPLLEKAGFAATVPEASPEVKEICDYVTELSGGMGAAREVMDILRIACDIRPDRFDFKTKLGQ